MPDQGRAGLDVIRHGSLCTGYGGLDLAVSSLLGGRLVWLAEYEDAPAQVCEVRFPDVPNLRDLTVIDWATVEPIDVLTAGYPCQPFSQAGQRKGTDDERHLWPYIAECVRVLRPRLVVLENVAGHVSLGLDRVLGDLAEAGLDAEWALVRASEVGACHQRERVFIVAADPIGQPVRDGGRGRIPGAAGAPEGDRAERERVRPGALDGGEDAPDPVRLGRGRLEDVRGRHGVADGSEGRRVEGDDPALARRQEAPADADDGRRGQRDEGQRRVPLADEGDPRRVWGDYADAIERHARALGRPAPAPLDDKQRLSARLVEWMMMLPDGWVTDVLTSRTKALKCLGNGVVPAQAAYAVAGLLERLDERIAA